MSGSDLDVFVTRSIGTPSEGVRDQYADGRAARVWEIFIGNKNTRTQHYRDFLVGLLREHGCVNILDVACGTGFDSVMLLEEGFKVTSVDASDKMLKYALKKRWERRKESAFDQWIIEEANWLTLPRDLKHHLGNQGGFDAVICLGNSFAHMLDTSGYQLEQKQALRNFQKCVKPGGLMLIDHRNYDNILDTCSTPSKSIYYNSEYMADIRTSVLHVDGRPAIVTLDYVIDLGEDTKNGEDKFSEFRLAYYPHKLALFKEMLMEAFGKNSKHTLFADFKTLNEVPNPAFYIHVVQKGTN